MPAPLAFAIEVTPADGDAPAPQSLEERWKVEGDDAELSLGDDHLHARIECARGQFAGRVSAVLVSDQPSLVARLLLETPAAALLARRSYGVVHAGAVAGPAGAVVIRGAPGAGKSTLVAAAHQAGLRVLGDESVLVARSDPDEILAAVRDVTLLPDATRLLGLEGAVTPIRRGAECKDRLDLFPSSTPAVRHARRVATLLLGSRTDHPVRLEPLDPDTFLREFRDGAIHQERWSGTPHHIEGQWSRSGAYRLVGTEDVSGAVNLLAQLVEWQEPVNRV